MLHKDIVEATIKKISDLNKNPEKERDIVFNIISTLNSFIYKDKELSDEEIQKLIDELTFYTTLMSIPLPSGTSISRAVKYTYEGEPCHNEISRLSYIPESKIELAELGRMNKIREPIFYGCLDTNPNSIGTALSEVNAQKNEKVNVLFSKTISVLQLIPIGVFDYFRRGIDHPFKIHNNYKEMYNLYKENTHPDAMIALHLCDAFLYQVLKEDIKELKEEAKEKTKKKLYRVTSQIAKECLKYPADGLIYSSVQFEDHPNVVINPQSIDTKVVHKEVISLEVIEDYGYGIYQIKKTHHAYIKDNIINWEKI